MPTPRPNCHCRVCEQARERGVPYARTGPSLFVHGPDLLIDTPEEARGQLNRSQVGAIAGCTYSHWHPDHVLGRRVWEARNYDWLHLPPQHDTTPIYLPARVVTDFRRTLGSWEHFGFLEKNGLIRIVELEDGESFNLGDTTVSPFRLHEDYVYGFLLDNGSKRILICPDETIAWRPSARHKGVDLAVLPMGTSEFHPLKGQRQIPRGHPVLKAECSYEETLEIIDALQAKRVILTHIEEPDGCSHDDLLQLEADLEAGGGKVSFAYDTMLIDVSTTRCQ